MCCIVHSILYKPFINLQQYIIIYYKYTINTYLYNKEVILNLFYKDR